MSEYFTEEVMENVRYPLDNEPSDTENTDNTDVPKEEKQAETKDEQLRKRLEQLKERHIKSKESEKTAANRTKYLAEQIEKVKKEIHAEEIARMDKFCEERNFTYDSMIDYFSHFSPNATMEDILALTT